ncbi:hypothetical protein TL16_g07860 [Triparma laevis f. inornata]|uniref:Uncharacterized protein n=1 Tax=Triparma laevis f. inornata TaxID=1714386 RepID=A0A9W7AXY2_9STRA|nr:hypothetical protein TL16_g07860 [Triparma laevis f. inornata]
MDDMFDVLSPGSVSLGSKKKQEELEQAKQKQAAEASSGDNDNNVEDEDDSDFYSDESDSNVPQPKKERDIIYEVEGSTDSEDEGDSDRGALGHEQNNNDAQSEMALHNVLLTPRLPPTPFDPPDYQPIIDRNKMLGTYRRIRDAYLMELDRHKATREEINYMLRRIEECKETGLERMDKMKVCREKQDQYLKEWADLEKVHKNAAKEAKRDVAELQTELRQLKHDVKYEIALKEAEERKLDRNEDELVKKERELAFLVRDVQVANVENQVLHQTSNKLDKALTTNKEITEDGEERLQKVSEELGLTEVDVFMLQREVKTAEEESRKWRQRYLMVEKDVRRAEKLLKDFTKSKSNELEAKHGSVLGNMRGGGSQGSRGFSGGGFRSDLEASINTSYSQSLGGGVLGSPMSVPSRASVSGGRDRTRSGDENRPRDVVKRGRRKRKDEKAKPPQTKSLSHMARSFNSVDELRGGADSTLMRAVLGGETNLVSTRGGMGDSRAIKATPFELKPLKSRGLENGGSQFGGMTTELAEGMPIDFHDTYHDIAVKNNRRGTAKARSYAQNSDLWPEGMDD